MAQGFAKSIEDLKGKVGDLAMSEPVMATGKYLGQLGEKAQRVYAEGKRKISEMLPAAKPATQARDIELPPMRAAQKRRTGKGRSLGGRR